MDTRGTYNIECDSLLEVRDGSDSAPWRMFLLANNVWRSKDTDAGDEVDDISASRSTRFRMAMRAWHTWSGPEMKATTCFS